MSLYITFEGPDATGKTTQATKLFKKLKKIYPEKHVLLTKEPGSKENEVCKSIRSILLNKSTEISDKSALLLFLADRAQHVTKVVQPVLKQNGIVISDRSSISTVVYHVAKILIGSEENISHDYFYEMLDFAQIVKPNICFITHADYEWCKNKMMCRAELDRIESFSDDYHKCVHEVFLEIATKHMPVAHEVLRTMKLCLKTFPEKMFLLKKTNEHTAEELANEVYEKISLWIDSHEGGW